MLLAVVAITVLVSSCSEDEEMNSSTENENVEVNSSPTIADQTFSISEDAIMGASIGTVSASDADNDTLTFSISSGNSDDVFSMNSSSGEITLAGTLDFETKPAFSLSISVSDGEESSSATVTINLNDVEESNQ